MSGLPKSLSFVSYAVNGHGLGHLVRMVAINRWLRRYAAYAGVKTQHWFLTTSEADSLLHREGFAGFKLPSKSVVGEAGIDKLDYLALAKQWVWHSVALLRPDVLLVDTFPNGSFHELMPVLDLCRHKALVLRPVRPAFAGPAFRAVANLYDRIVVPGHPHEAGGMRQLGLDPQRLRFVGPVMRGERFEVYDQQEARARLGVPEAARCWLVSAGGGGDETADALYARMDALTASAPDTWLVFAAGPLYRGRPRGGARRVWWTTPDLVAHLPAFDGAVAAGGFNTVHELLFAGIPTVFVPQDKIADDQLARAHAFGEAGAARVASLEGDSLAQALEALRDPQQTAALTAAAHRVVSRNHARDAAAEVLGLVLPEDLIERAREDLADELLTQAARQGLGAEDLCELARALPGGEPDLPLEVALDLWKAAQAAGATLAATQNLVRLLASKGRKGPVADPGALGLALTELLEEDDVRHQGSALSLLLRVWPTDRGSDSVGLAQALRGLIKRAATQGVDVFLLARRAQEALDAGRAEDSQGLLVKLEASFTPQQRWQA
ncbi:MAG: hypothetical protein KA712_12100 [Myxococcales bacterium]|nr:hypothetical protein [Myxococcales bacterium]